LAHLFDKERAEIEVVLIRYSYGFHDDESGKFGKPTSYDTESRTEMHHQQGRPLIDFHIRFEARWKNRWKIC
jgi:hypothetical protein